MKKLIVFVLVSLSLLLIGCEDKNVLYKDDTYVITKTETSVDVQIVGSYAPVVHDAAKEYINDTQLPCLYVLSYEDNVLTVTSHDYDGDAKRDFKQWKLSASKDIAFSYVSVVDDNGNVTIDNAQIPKEDYKYIGEYYTGGYFEFNNTGEVTKIIFYGDTIIQG